MKSFRSKQNLALLAAAILVLGIWVFGWGGGSIRVIRVSPDEVDHIRISATIVDSHAITVTEPEDIQFVIDTINSFSYTGNNLKCILRGELFLSGTLLYELNFSLRNGDAFSLCLASNNSTDLSDMELTYWIHDENRFPISSMCRGSMEWYDTLYEAYSTSQ